MYTVRLQSKVNLEIGSLYTNWTERDQAFPDKTYHYVKQPLSFFVELRIYICFIIISFCSKEVS